MFAWIQLCLLVLTLDFHTVNDVLNPVLQQLLVVIFPFVFGA